MPSYYYTKFQKNPCVGRNERCPFNIFEYLNRRVFVMYVVNPLCRNVTSLVIFDVTSVVNKQGFFKCNGVVCFHWGRLFSEIFK